MTEIIKSKINKTADRKAYDKEYNSKYYKENRSYWFDPHICECGSKYDMSHKSRHQCSKKHKKFMQNQEMQMENKEIQVPKPVEQCRTYESHCTCERSFCCCDIRRDFIR